MKDGLRKKYLNIHIIVLKNTAGAKW